MYRLSHGLILAVFWSLLGAGAVAQTSGADANTTCNFDANKQLAVEYQRLEIPHGKKALGTTIPYGKVWSPGGKPLTLFTNTPVSVGNTQIPDGAYTMFIVPEGKSWTLILSKSTDTSGKYDESRDLARIPMQFGKLMEAEPAFTAYFAHVAVNQCNLRLDLGKARAWVVFERK